MVKKVKACLLTGILGDAFGSKFELLDIPAGDDRWTFTDDTQLTVATCEAILTAQKVDLSQVAKTFQEWYREGRIKGIGASTLMAMVQLQGGTSWTQSGTKGDHAAANDAAMRIAPFAFLHDPTNAEHRETIRQACQITHNHDEAYHAALAVILAIRVADADHLNTIPYVIKHLPHSEVRKRLEGIAGMPKPTIREVARKNGNGPWAVESIPFAIFAASQANELGIHGMMKAIASTGGDTDTNCAIAGQIAGAALGMEGLLPEWNTKLQRTLGYDEYYTIIRRFAEFVNQQQGIQTLF